MIIDAHTHLGLESFIVKKIPDWKLKKPAFQVKMENNIETLIHSMDKSGVEKSVVFPFPLEEIDSAAANEYVLNNAIKFPSRIIPFALVDHEPERWIKLGARGFKQHFLLAPERFNSSEVYRVMEKYRVPLVAHFTTGKALEEAMAILNFAPNLKLIIAHMGRQIPNTGEGVLKLAFEFKDKPNVYFETSTVYDPGVIREVVDIVGSRRVIFGSDFPFNSDIKEDSVLFEIDIIAGSFKDSRIRERIFCKNIELVLEDN